MSSRVARALEARVGVAPRRRVRAPGCGADRLWAIAASVAGIAVACGAPARPTNAGHLVSLEELAEVRSLAEAGAQPVADRRDALLEAARAPWRWGSVSGTFVTTVGSEASKRCHPASDPDGRDYLKEGAPDAYAKALAYWVAGTPDAALAEDARSRIVDLLDTKGFHGLAGDDQSASNQCILELGLSMPVWIETAELLASTPVWSDADRVGFARWLAAEVYPRVAWASRVRRNNWGAAGSAAASAIADYVDGVVPSLAETSPTARRLTPPSARAEHDAMQLQRIGTVWRGDTRCRHAGIQAYGGIPDELRRGAAGCDGTFLPAGDDPSHTYQTMHVELLVLHAEAQRRRGDTTLFDARVANGGPAILQAILFVIDNPTDGGRSWPWGPRTGALAVADRYYHDPRLARALEAADTPTARGGRTLPYARLAPASLEPSAPGND